MNQADMQLLAMMMAASQKKPVQPKRSGCRRGLGCLVFILLLVVIWFPWEFVLR